MKPTINQIKEQVLSRGGVLFMDEPAWIKSLARLDFIVDAVAYKGLTYKEASLLWDEDEMTTLHTRVETITI